jgi:YXWGXW repeat-containing protein
MRIARFVLLLVLAAGILTIPAPSHAQVAVGVSIRIGPPILPVYAQPICPGPDYIWTPGYWAYSYDDEDYFWVPGTWVLAPEPGLLWTPGYWGFAEGVYFWHAGYWGPRVGFYGGINYGFGYPGTGFYGGYWRGRNYYYNRSVTNVNVTVIHNVYNKTVINERTVNRVSFNGGPGGIHYQPNRDERRAEHERHFQMTSEQNHHFEAARGDRGFRASVNHGRPEVAATPRSGDFRGSNIEHGRGDDRNRVDDRGRFDDRGRGNDRNRPEDLRDSNRRDRNFDNRPGRGREDHGRDFDRPPSSRHSENPSSNPRLEQRHEREFDKMQRQQDADRQKMQRRYDQDQQKLNRQNANQQRQDQLQRRQQQQMDQMNRRQEQQNQKLQQRQEREHQKEQRQEGKPHGNGHGRP